VLGDPRLPFALGRVRVPAGGEARADVRLTPAVATPVAAGAPALVGAAAAVACERPLASAGRRRMATLPGAGGASGQGLLYTPAAGAEGAGWPLLLTVYPGPAAEWECASVPLAAAGFAVLAVAPAYGFAPEGDVTDLARWLRLARAGALPEVDGGRVAVLAGSYSALHVQRLLQRPEAAGLRGVVLLGAPSDLFDARRRLEDGTYVPPFGLDGALVALGFPDREPLRYWRYSWAYHVRRELPPVALIHSRQDEVVPFQQSEALARSLEAVGAPHRLHVFEAASHYLLSEDGDSRAIYELTVAFLRERLAG
jgi:dipeptidyl aminopeptidase/acylaminoacyl peptidase